MPNTYNFKDDVWGDDAFLTNLMGSYIDQNQSWIDSAKDDDQKAARQQKLNDRLEQIMNAYNTYGKQAFTPKPKASELTNMPWQQDNYSGRTEFSPYDPTKIGENPSDPEVPSAISPEQQAMLASYRGQNVTPQDLKGLLNIPFVGDVDLGTAGKYINTIGGSANQAALKGEQAALDLGVPYATTLLGPAIPNKTRQDIEDRAFSLGDKLADLAEAQDTGQTSGFTGGASRFAGSMAGALATGGAGMLAEPFDTLRDNGSMTTAAEQMAVRAPQFGINLALGGMEAPFLKRAAIGIPGAVGTNIASTYVANQIPGAQKQDPWDVESNAQAAGAGLFGAIVGPGKKPEIKFNRLPAGLKDPDIISGFQAGKAANDVEFGQRQGDLFNDKNEPYGVDMFDSKTVPADIIESRRQQSDLAYNKELPQRTHEEDLDLEKNYLFSQNERLRNLSAQEPSVPAEDLWDVGAKGVVEQKLADPNANAAMASAFEQAGLRRGLGMKDTNLYPDIRNQPENAPQQSSLPFEPSRNPTVEQTAPVQGRLDLPSQGDLFGDQQPSQAPTVAATETPVTAPASTKASTQARAKSLLDEIASDEGTAPRAYPATNSSGLRLPYSIVDAADKGQLTVQHVMDAIGDNHEQMFSQSPEAQGFAQLMRDAGNRLGGLDTKIEIVPKEGRSAEQQAVVDRLDNHPNAAMKFGESAGVYDPVTNKIYMNGDENLAMHSLAHESTHAITQHAISLGEEGKLQGPQLQAFQRLTSVFDSLKPHLEDLANKSGKTERDVDNLKYGVSNLHEMMAETFSNGKFREFLKGLKLDSLDQAKLGFGRLALGKVRNMYDAVVGSIRDMLGLSPKAANALDTLVSASHDFLKSFDDKAAGEIQKVNSRNTEPAFKPRDNGILGTSANHPLDKSADFKDRMAGAFKRFNPVFQTIRKSKEEMESRTNAARAESQEIAKALDKAAKSEGAPNDKIVDYLSKKDPGALNSYPKTKSVADAFDVKRQENRRELAKALASNPNATAKDVEIAEHIYHNPGYLMRKYQPENVTSEVLRTARSADDIAAKDGQLTGPQAKAKQIVDNARNWIRQNMLPAADFENKQLSTLKKMAKDLGINANKLIRKADAKDVASKKEIVKQAIKDALPDEAAMKRAEDALLLQVAGVVENKGLSVARYYRGLRLGDILTEREAVPPQLRALWGEVSDAASQVAHTYLKQETGITQLKQQAKLREIGLAKGWLTDKKFSNPGFTAKMSGRKMGALADTYTTPLVKRMLDSTITIQKASDNWTTATFSGNEARDKAMFLGKSAISMWPRAVTGFKMFTMGFNPKYWMMYAAGGPSIMLTHGVVNPAYGVRGLLAHVAELAPDALKALPKSVQDRATADMDLIRKYGFSEPTASGEYYKYIQGKYLAEALQNGGEKNFPQMLQQFMGNIASMPLKTAMHLMSAGDGWAKRGAYLHRIDVLDSFNERQGNKPAGGQALKDYYETLHSDAADWVKDTTINYGRAPWMARVSESYLGTSKGLVYVTETARNLINGVAHGFADLRTGMEAKDSTMMAHGVKQIVGSLGAATAMSTVLGKVIGLALGITGLASNQVAPDDDKQKFLQQKGSRFEGQRVEELSGTDDPTHNYFHAQGDTDDYYYQFSEATHVLMDAVAAHERGEKVDLNDTTRKAFGAFMGTLGRGALMTQLIRVAEAKTPGWQDQAPKFTEAERTFIKNNFGLEESNVNRVMAAFDGVMPGMIKSWIQANESPGNDTIKNLMRSGFSVSAVPKDAGLSDKFAGIVKKRLDDSTADFHKTIANPADYNDSVISDSYKKAFVQSYDVLKDLQGAITFAKSNQLSNGEVMKSMMLGKIPEDAIVQAYTGKLNPAEILYKDLSSKLVDEIEKAPDSERKQELTRRYVGRMRQIAALTRQYMQLTPDQIEEMK